MSETRKQRAAVNIRIHPMVKAKVEVLAAQSGMTLSEFVRWTLADRVKDMPTPNGKRKPPSS